MGAAVLFPCVKPQHWIPDASIDARSEGADFRCATDLPFPGGDSAGFFLFRAKSALIPWKKHENITLISNPNRCDFTANIRAGPH